MEIWLKYQTGLQFWKKWIWSTGLEKLLERK